MGFTSSHHADLPVAGFSLRDAVDPPYGPDFPVAAAGVDARYVEIDTDFGHSASGREWAKWAPTLGEFLARLDR